MKNIAIYSQETKDAKRIISFLKSIGVDTKHHKGQKEFKVIIIMLLMVCLEHQKNLSIKLMSKL